MIINPEDLNAKENYKLLCGSIVPRPIAWISTISEEGIYNVAPFSFFTVAANDPPTICVSIGPGISEDITRLKDTFQNINITKEFVVNIASTSFIREVQTTSQVYSPDTDEFIKAGLEPIKSNRVNAPRIKGVPISMECKLIQIVNVGKNKLVLGEVVQYHIVENVYMGNNKINVKKLQPLARLAGSYATINEVKMPTNLELSSNAGK